jgi:RNA polymerase sigma-70 factor (ECF subfamily)
MSAFDELVTRYRQRAFAMIYQIVRNEQDAWDLAQDGFVRAWKSIGRFKSEANVFTWLHRIMTNVAIDWLRSKKNHPEQEFDETIDSDPQVGTPASDAPGPRRELERAELRIRIDAALERLSPEHRAVITLKEIEGLQYHEIAGVMDCSIGTVMSRLFHARRKLQRMLADLHGQS